MNLKERLEALKNTGIEDVEVDYDIDDEQDNNGGFFIEGYGAYDVKITMARLETYEKSKVTNLVLTFETKDGKVLDSKFIMTGKDGQVKDKNGRLFGSISQVISLLTVLGLYKGEQKGKALYDNAEVATVKYNNYGKEKEEDAITFPDLIGKKVKIAVSSKKVNLNTQNDGSAYVKFCIKEVEKFCKKNPKKATCKKFDAKDDYVPAYRWVVETEVKHFCTIDGLMQSEIESGEGKRLEEYLSKKEAGFVYDARILKVEELPSATKSKYGLDEFGKITEPDDSEDIDEPDIEPEESGDDDW